MKKLEKYSFGVGDRFCLQAKAQLRAVMDLRELGVEVVPVWNKSNREHLIVGTEPGSTREAADAAVRELGWDRSYYCDADHIRLDTVGQFISSCDFFTIDVADSIGVPADADAVQLFLERHPELRVRFSKGEPERAAILFLGPVADGAAVYRHIVSLRGGDDFITEVSMDETLSAQTSVDLLVILAALADEVIPIQTIAPKFSGRFNKGVDYVGDVGGFEEELSENIAIIDEAIKTYGLPESLKLSIHSGSDKFSLYPALRRVLKKTNAGIHVKTAGTTWLEEIIGLAEAGGAGLLLAKDVYAEAFEHRSELCEPYATVIDIEPCRLPSPSEVASWSAGEFVRSVRHDPEDPLYNSSMRQLLHVGYKVAAKMGERYIDQVRACEDSIARNVRYNLFERHLKPIFVG